MQAFRHDFESVELTPGELATFAEVVQAECRPEMQERLSRWLGGVHHEQPLTVQEYAQYQASCMWR